MNEILKENFGYIMETCHEYGTEQCNKIGEMMIMMNYPKEVYTYFQNSDILSIVHLYIINYLLTKKHQQTSEFIKKYLRMFLLKLSENTELLTSYPNDTNSPFSQNNQNVFQNQTIQNFSFLFVCVQRNKQLKNTEPFITFFQLLFSRYPPRIIDSIKRQLSMICEEPVEADVVYVNPAEYSKPTLRCKKCLECFTSSFDAIKHSKICKNKNVIMLAQLT